MSEEYGIFYGSEIFNYPTEKEPIIEGILYENDCICISSAPKVGKSILAKQMFCSLTSGSPFLEMFKIPRPMKVLYVQSEGDRSETIQRLENMRKGVSINWDNLAHMNINGIKLNTYAGLKEFIRLADVPQMQYDVIIIDPLYTTVQGSMKDDNVATDWIRNVREIRAKYGCAVIVMNHEVKDTYYKGKKVDMGRGRTFGSQMWLAFFNHNFVFTRSEGLHVLEVGEQRSGRIVNKVVMKLLHPSPLMYVVDVGESPTRANKVLDILKNNPRGYTQKELTVALGTTVSTVSRAIHDLKGVIDQYREDGVTYYRVKDENHNTVAVLQGSQ